MKSLYEQIENSIIAHSQQVAAQAEYNTALSAKVDLLTDVQNNQLIIMGAIADLYEQLIGGGA